MHSKNTVTATLIVLLIHFMYKNVLRTLRTFVRFWSQFYFIVLPCYLFVFI